MDHWIQGTSTGWNRNEPKQEQITTCVVMTKHQTNLHPRCQYRIRSGSHNAITLPCTELACNGTPTAHNKLACVGLRDWLGQAKSCRNNGRRSPVTAGWPAQALPKELRSYRTIEHSALSTKNTMAGHWQLGQTRDGKLSTLGATLKVFWDMA